MLFTLTLLEMNKITCLLDYRCIDGETSSVYNNETEVSFFEGIKLKITE